ncbi:hypothetical protein TNCT_219051 [Trichonephila clavata]|uniref:Uncharacterized protein n=1 Tax=Trichonephila clavata TaxID=2740835 RepID=A0A8X6LE39_TRICU|nr:hypothetical protein TNCT_219051 [Trichonephila clavata]
MASNSNRIRWSREGKTAPLRMGMALEPERGAAFSNHSILGNSLKTYMGQIQKSLWTDPITSFPNNDNTISRRSLERAPRFSSLPDAAGGRTPSEPSLGPGRSAGCEDHKQCHQSFYPRIVISSTIHGMKARKVFPIYFDQFLICGNSE